MTSPASTGIADGHRGRNRLVGRALGAVIDRDDVDARHLAGEGHDAAGDGPDGRTDERGEIDAAVAGSVVRIGSVELARHGRRLAAEAVNRPHPRAVAGGDWWHGTGK